MEYIVAGAVGFFILLYVACSFLIFKVLAAKNPDAFQGISGIKKGVIILIVPILAIAMAAIISLSKQTNKDK